ncbi:ATP-binding protein [Hymenobacter metallilatus]|uniref:Sensory/regulatory protein RpfC n=1 Tax=Hymenobacter metallilatus TaxID=2493666 RepID=A0A3R9P7G1_9BACT|nr:ATP-binding protein [Hymenobacter metallilatus]RSK30103.1 PAS domain-containing sensor histidine kinase [Hymenobacter metallilatus]
MSSSTALPFEFSDAVQAHQRIQELERELQAAKEAARTMENRLGHLINYVQEGVLLTDTDGRISLVNERFCQLWDMPQPAAYWVGRSWQEMAAVMIPLVADGPAFEQRIHALRAGGQPVFNERVDLSDGRILERDFIPVQQVDTLSARSMIRLRDATEYHRAAEQLRAVASIPGQNPNPIFRIDGEGQVLYNNPSASALHASLNDADQNRLLAKIQRLASAALTQNAPWQVDIPVGNSFYAVFVVPFPEEGYANLYLVNITKRMLVEQELNHAKDEAEAAVRARENFLANMSHEIRTPMNGVLGMATQLSKTRLDARQQDFLRIIRTSGQHLLSIINDVLDMAKITSGKLEFEQTAFNLCDSMAEALQPLVHQAIEKGISVAGTPLKTSCSLPWVIGDPYRLNQVLINLMANAIKFTEAGGHITVIGRQLAATADTLTVEFLVTDTGIGIPAEQLERIFEGFTQAYADTTRRFGGTGLGLSISRAIIEQLGGTLTVHSKVGKGSTFRFQLTLPRTTAQAATATASAFDTGVLRGRRVLLVEDNEINRDVARMLLEEWGVEVHEAEDGQRGVEQYQRQSYDAILMDIQMPGMSGLEATALIRQLPDATKANVPILALTANAFRADYVKYLAAGMTDCLTKPFEELELYQALEKLMPPAGPKSSYDLTKLRTLAHGREAFVLKIIRSFLLNMPESLVQLETAAATGNWQQVAALVHHIKPGIESLGIQDVAGALQQLEQQAAGPGAEQSLAHAAVARIVAQVKRALHELPRELPAEA